MKRLTVLAALVVAVLSVTVTAALAASSTSNWHVGYYTGSNKTLSYSQASNAGLGGLNFSKLENTALLVTSQKLKGSGLLANMTGKSVTASATIGGLTGTVN